MKADDGRCMRGLAFFLWCACASACGGTISLSNDAGGLDGAQVADVGSSSGSSSGTSGSGSSSGVLDSSSGSGSGAGSGSSSGGSGSGSSSGAPQDACAGWSPVLFAADGGENLGCEECARTVCQAESCACQGDPLFVSGPGQAGPACTVLALCGWAAYLNHPDATADGDLSMCGEDGGLYAASSISLARSMVRCWAASGCSCSL